MQFNNNKALCTGCSLWDVCIAMEQQNKTVKTGLIFNKCCVYLHKEYSTQYHSFYAWERERFDGKNNIPSFVHILISRYIHCFLCNKKPQLCAYTCILVLWVWSLVHLQTKSPNHVQKNPNFALTCVHTLLFWMWTLHFIWKYNAPSKFLDLDKSNKRVHTLLYFHVFRVRSTHCFIFLYLGLCPA